MTSRREEDSDERASTLSRREMLQGTGALAATLVIGCSGTVDDPNGSGDTRDGDAMGAGGDSDAGGDAANRAPVWQTIPDQTWVAGVPVMLDLADYCSDPDGDALAYSLDLALPPGVTLNGSIISGTPTTEFATAQYVATADDGA